MDNAMKGLEGMTTRAPAKGPVDSRTRAVTPAAAPKVEAAPVAEAPKAPAAERMSAEIKAEADAKTAPEVEAPAAPKESKAGKESPWKLVDTYKKKTVQLETELAELKKHASPQNLEERKQIEEKLTQREARLKELEDEIRYVNYSKSEEYKTKYEKPYSDAWAKAVSELSELNVLKPDGSERPATAQDMLELCNLPTGEARKRANELFGDSAQDVMDHRKALKGLYEEQQKALDDMKKNGAEREKTKREEFLKKIQTSQTETAQIWEQANKQAMEKQEYLRPREGDEEYNTKLTKAYEFVDAALKGNANDPKLSPEDRKAVIERHAALRNRAVMYTPLKMEVSRLKTQLSEAQAKLKQYEGSVPTSGDGKGKTGSNAEPADPMEAAINRLTKKAR